MSRAPRRGSRGPATTRPAARPAGFDFDAAFAAVEAPADETVNFDQLGLPPALVTALAHAGLTTAFAIQARAIPDGLAGRDVLGRAKTGSGKTLAFGLPLLARLQGGQRRPGRPRGLVLVPTRELAEQVKGGLAPLAHELDLRVAAVYGGAPIRRQMDALRRGVDVIVATPGRLEDLINQRECFLDGVEVTVLDEADYMADLGFLPAVTRLLDATPAGTQRLLFSATLDAGVSRLVTKYLTDPALHAVTPTPDAAITMRHQAFRVVREDKVDLTAEIVARPARTLVFVRTKHGADRLAKQISRTGTAAAAIHGNLAQNARQRALDAFAAGSCRVLVATDVAARGIHVDDVDLVVHYDPPTDHKDYLHRSGRTARAGADGLVLSLLLPEQTRDAVRLFEKAGVDVPTTPVSPGAPAVRTIAESGEEIVVTAVAPSPAPAQGHSRPRTRHSHRPRAAGRTSVR